MHHTLSTAGRNLQPDNSFNNEVLVLCWNKDVWALLERTWYFVRFPKDKTKLGEGMKGEVLQKEHRWNLQTHPASVRYFKFRRIGNNSSRDLPSSSENVIFYLFIVIDTFQVCCYLGGNLLNAFEEKHAQCILSILYQRSKDFVDVLYSCCKIIAEG